MLTGAPPLPPRPVGRPRDPALDVAILAAALDLLGEGGLETCALDAVARRAGVGKATIYRRWPSKDALVRDAFGSTAPDLLPADDHGSLVADAAVLLAALAAALRAPRALAWRRTVPALGPDSPLLALLPPGPVGDWTGAVAAVVARAERRGEVGAGAFPPLALRAACAVLVERWLTGDGARGRGRRGRRGPGGRAGRRAAAPAPARLTGSDPPPTCDACHDSPVAARDWRARKRDATRQRLSAAAFALFAERGYDAVSVGDIAAAAGVSVPTFYAYFRTKEHVVLPDQDALWIDSHFAGQPAGLDLTERIRRGLRAMVDDLPPEALAERLSRWSLVLAVPALRLRAAERQQASAAVLVQATGVDLATSEGAADVVVVAACLTAATTAFLRWAATGGEHPIGDLLDEAFDALRSIEPVAGPDTA